LGGRGTLNQEGRVPGALKDAARVCSVSKKKRVAVPSWGRTGGTLNAHKVTGDVSSWRGKRKGAGFSEGEKGVKRHALATSGKEVGGCFEKGGAVSLVEGVVEARDDRTCMISPNFPRPTSM